MGSEETRVVKGSGYYNKDVVKSSMIDLDVAHVGALLRYVEHYVCDFRIDRNCRSCPVRDGRFCYLQKAVECLRDFVGREKEDPWLLGLDRCRCEFCSPEDYVSDEEEEEEEEVKEAVFGGAIGGGKSYASHQIAEANKEKVAPHQDTTEEDIDHPAHYSAGRKIEPIDVIEDWGLDFCLGNVIKYIGRAGRKPESDFMIDLCKAQWYLRREVHNFSEWRIKRP